MPNFQGLFSGIGLGLDEAQVLQSGERLHCLLEEERMGENSWEKGEGLRRNFSSLAICAPLPSTSSVVRLKIEYTYKRFAT